MSLIPRGNFMDIDRFFNDFWSPVQRESESTQSFFAPRVDIKENKDHYEITADLPGVKKEDIHITLNDGVLTLEASLEQQNKDEKEEGQFIRRERRYGRYMRSFNLGSEVHEEDISASFNDGVLTLVAPKVAETQPVQRRIEVS